MYSYCVFTYWFSFLRRYLKFGLSRVLFLVVLKVKIYGCCSSKEKMSFWLCVVKEPFEFVFFTSPKTETTALYLYFSVKLHLFNLQNSKLLIRWGGAGEWGECAYVYCRGCCLSGTTFESSWNLSQWYAKIHTNGGYD